LSIGTLLALQLDDVSDIE